MPTLISNVLACLQIYEPAFGNPLKPEAIKQKRAVKSGIISLRFAACPKLRPNAMKKVICSRSLE